MVKNPLLNYHGGKWAIAPKITSLFPPHNTYVEPFGGGGAVLLFKERSHTEVYNDLDDNIVNLFVTIQRGVFNLSRMKNLQKHFFQNSIFSS
jgi:DNA adenine methylase